MVTEDIHQGFFGGAAEFIAKVQREGFQESFREPLKSRRRVPI